MHLAAVHRFLHDPSVPDEICQTLSQEGQLGAFLLGNVAPDARVSGGHSRAKTHFFEYGAKIQPRASENLFAAHPELKLARDQQRSFVAGYLAHLAMDEVWAETLLYPYFYLQQWGDQMTRFIMLHVLLCYLDERDYRQWDESYAVALQNAQPQAWLPFLPDSDLCEWRDVIARQICAGCQSETVAILGTRVPIKAQGLRAILENPTRMQAELWDHVPLSAVHVVEEAMYRAMVKSTVEYMDNKP